MMPNERKANEAQFFFSCGLPQETFSVLRFEGTDAVSEPYRFSILLRSSKHDVDPADVINKPAAFFIFREGDYCPYSGVVEQFRFLGTNVDQASYEVTLVPRLSLLDYQHQTRIFQKKSYPEIVRDVLDTAGFRNSYQLDLSQNYPAQEYVLQYQESDLNFISRLMETAGIWYYWKESAVAASQVKPGSSQEKLVITDKPASFQSIQGVSKLKFRNPSSLMEVEAATARESVHEVTFRQVIVPQEVLVKNYNYRTPEVQLTGRNKVKTGVAGSVYEYGGSFRNVTEAQRAAEVASNRIATRQMSVDGASDCRGFRAGCRFTLVEHGRRDLNAEYVLCRVTHTGGHTGDVISYANSFQALPADRAGSFAPQRRAVIPKVNGVMTALIEAQGSDYAALDDMGRYKVRMPFDNSDAQNSEASKYLRLAQPYAGAKYGMHFPSHEGTEMVWACVDGDPSKPVGLGTVPNSNTMSPVVSANKAQNIIRTAGGNELLLDDTDKKQKARLTTAARHTLEMDDDLKRISLKSTGENELMLDDKNECVRWNGSGHSITMTYKSGSEGVVIATKEGNVVKLDDKNKKVIIQSKAGHTLEMDDDGKTMVLTDCAKKNKVTLDGNGGLILDSQGKIEIKAQQDIEIKGANITIDAQAGLEAKAMTDMKLKGMNVEAKADMNAKVEGGMNIELKGGMQAKLDGAMTDISGSAMTKVQGGMVMIN
ncbi:MAG: type VI secretion system tip protein VgrG [Chitinispirillaceae bacterium]|nr:type VI secretion system tip protein VgrG [Chitinispirillaceae bacterium]